jgi:hypothetical protein
MNGKLLHRKKECIHKNEMVTWRGELFSICQKMVRKISEGVSQINVLKTKLKNGQVTKQASLKKLKY